MLESSICTSYWVQTGSIRSDQLSEASESPMTPIFSTLKHLTFPVSLSRLESTCGKQTI